MQKFWNILEKHGTAIVLGWAILLRAILMGFYRHVSLFPDAGYYRNLATYISRWNLTGYTGERTPGYPVIIALMGEQLWLVVALQMALGVLVTYLVYDMAWLLLKKKGAAALTALVYTSFLFVPFFEFAILTETWSIFLLQLSMWLIVRCKLLEKEATISKYMITALVMAALFLTRPMFIYLPILFGLFYCWKHMRIHFLKSVAVTVLLCGTTFMAQVAWQEVNYQQTGNRQTTYFMGYNLIQTATHFYEKIPDDHAQVRDILLKHRQRAQDSLTETQVSMTVWYAEQELLEETQLSKPELGAYFKEIAVPLFKENKLDYVRQVGLSFKLFWGAQSHFLWNKESMHPVLLQKVIIGIAHYIQSPLLVLLNLIFLAASLFILWKALRNKLKNIGALEFMVSAVLAASVAQALVAYGDNSRFAFPFFGIIVVVTVFALLRLLDYYKNLRARK